MHTVNKPLPVPESEIIRLRRVDDPGWEKLWLFGIIVRMRESAREAGLHTSLDGAGVYELVRRNVLKANNSDNLDELCTLERDTRALLVECGIHLDDLGKRQKKQ